MLSSFYKLKIRKLISATSVRYLCRIIYATHIVLSKNKKNSENQCLKNENTMQNAVRYYSVE